MPKFLEKTTSLGISGNISPKSQTNHIILVKLSKNKHFLGLNQISIVPCGSVKGLPQILTQPIIGPSMYSFWMQVSSSDYLFFSTLPRRNNNGLFWFRTQFGHFFIFYFILFIYLFFHFFGGMGSVRMVGWGVITPVNNVRLS